MSPKLMPGWNQTRQWARSWSCSGSEQVVIAIRLATLFGFDLPNACFDQLLDKTRRDRFVHGEMDRPPALGEALKITLKRLDHGGGREQAAVIRKRGEPHQHLFIFERGNPVADGLGSRARERRPNGGSNLPQHAAGGLRDARRVFVHQFWSALVLSL